MGALPTCGCSKILWWDDNVIDTITTEELIELTKLLKKEYMTQKRKVIMVDLEDTLTDTSHRIKVKEFADLNIWNSQLVDDPIRMKIAEVVASLSVGFDVVISTAKPMKYRDIAIEWMKKNLPFNIQRVMFRQQGDMRNSPELKMEHYRKVSQDQEVILAIDDRKDVCDMYESMGIPAFHCPNPKKDPSKKLVGSPDLILENAAGIFKRKSEEYGDGYKHYGKVLVGLFPDGVALNTEDDFCRWGVFTMIVSKISRYSSNFEEGGHQDCLDDGLVYNAMLQELDQIAKG